MGKYQLIAATGCPTGIAHTYMAQEALEQAARKKGITIKVETHGQIGIENELTAEEINRQMLSLLPQTKMSIQKDLRENESLMFLSVQESRMHNG
ncbi:PTS system fructose-specific transporter subunit IIBC [Enterococcus faecium]|nr:hypothetical protein [Enterococcus faecium]NMO70227.1 hypothetical protein [Enterococcus faecium]QMX47846.1 hypothetical protein HI861_009250 [Enterococcus faecium]SMJ22792.1 PTS system fructose-specific transporter subunit IIBC [Enterococcus faecium]SMJ34476.1 PTS system fructose-specific transporter subunit IIBC [Enterococcus faecium]